MADGAQVWITKAALDRDALVKRLTVLKDKAERGQRPSDKPFGRWLGDFLDQATTHGLLLGEFKLLEACGAGKQCDLTPPRQRHRTKGALARARKRGAFRWRANRVRVLPRPSRERPFGLEKLPPPHSKFMRHRPVITKASALTRPRSPVMPANAAGAAPGIHDFLSTARSLATSQIPSRLSSLACRDGAWLLHENYKFFTKPPLINRTFNQLFKSSLAKLWFPNN
jgi:hypothetical protein